MFVFGVEGRGEGLDGPLEMVKVVNKRGVSEQKKERINVKKKRKKENKTKKNPKLISVINLRSPKKEEEWKPTMEAYKYPLISQPNSVHYATCLGLVEYYLSV